MTYEELALNLLPETENKSGSGKNILQTLLDESINNVLSRNEKNTMPPA